MRKIIFGVRGSGFGVRGFKNLKSPSIHLRKQEILNLKSLILFSIFHFALLSNVFAEFTLPETGARQQGMGNAFIGLSDSPYAMVFNPAGLVSITSYEVSFSYTTSDSKYDFLGITLPQRIKGNCGLSVLSRYDKAIYFSYGKGLKIKNKAFSGGASIKLFKSENEKKGIGFDSGILYSLGNNLKVGFVLGNLLRNDFGYGFGLSFKYKNFLFTSDIKEREKSSFHFGVEKRMKKFFARAGIDDKKLSIGLSRELSGIDINFSLSPLSLSFGFGY